MDASPRVKALFKKALPLACIDLQVAHEDIKKACAFLLKRITQDVEGCNSAETILHAPFIAWKRAKLPDMCFFQVHEFAYSGVPFPKEFIPEVPFQGMIKPKPPVYNHRHATELFQGTGIKFGPDKKAVEATTANGGNWTKGKVGLKNDGKGGAKGYGISVKGGPTSLYDNGKGYGGTSHGGATSSTNHLQGWSKTGKDWATSSLNDGKHYGPASSFRPPSLLAPKAEPGTRETGMMTVEAPRNTSVQGVRVPPLLESTEEKRRRKEEEEKKNAKVGFVNARDMIPKRQKGTYEEPEDQGNSGGGLLGLGKQNSANTLDNGSDDQPERKKSKKDKDDGEKEKHAIEQKILDEIICDRPNVSFDDIVGLEGPKQSLKQMIILPLLNPSLYTGLRKPPRGLLMFGPGGNGKTFIAKAVASVCKDVTFFNLSAASLTSKWLGESEKIMKALFKIANERSPSLIFIDEIDSIMSKRGGSENEATRRLKTEFLVSFDGLTSATSDKNVTVLAATNRPWDLDEAALRRFTERFYVPLPTKGAREMMFQKLLPKEQHSLTDEEFNSLVEQTEGYAAFEVEGTCRRAASQQMRDLSFEEAINMKPDQLRPLKFLDFSKALRVIRPANSGDAIREHEQWNAKYGSAEG